MAGQFQLIINIDPFKLLCPLQLLRISENKVVFLLIEDSVDFGETMQLDLMEFLTAGNSFIVKRIQDENSQDVSVEMFFSHDDFVHLRLYEKASTHSGWELSFEKLKEQV